MSAGKEIRKQIKGVKSTRKITSAMEMVAASKMRKAQDRMRASRPYAQEIDALIARMASSNLYSDHPFLVNRAEQKVGLIIVSTDRGLCGGLNNNLFKKIFNFIDQKKAEKISVKTCLLGSKAVQLFKKIADFEIDGIATNLGEAPHAQDLLGVVKVMLDAYQQEGIDKLYIAYNLFVNTMTQEPVIQQLLPLNKDKKLSERSWEYIYEPHSKELLEELLQRYIESQVYQGVIENVACEQAARMVAMKAASDNATSLINELQLVYNKARQAAITQELSEIVAGAGAV